MRASSFIYRDNTSQPSAVTRTCISHCADGFYKIPLLLSYYYTLPVIGILDLS